MGRKTWVVALLAVVAVAALGSTAQAAPQAKKLDKVTLELKWVAPSQFAGYYAALSKGYYKAFGLDVTLKVGGPSITPEVVVASGQAQIGVDWLPSRVPPATGRAHPGLHGPPTLPATRDTGRTLVTIAQMFQRLVPVSRVASRLG